MATIGTFTQTQDGYTGAIKTLLLNTKAVIRSAEPGDNDKAPTFRVLTDKGVEIGAVWKKTAKSGGEYLSVKIDDPSLNAPIYASLVAGDEVKVFNLIWSRSSNRSN